MYKSPQYADAANFGDFTFNMQAGRPDGNGVFRREDVNAPSIKIIHFLCFRNALFFDKHDPAQQVTTGQIIADCNLYALALIHMRRYRPTPRL